MSSSDNCTPCSTVSTPATRQLCSPVPANAWQETLCPLACASSTNACTSSRVKVGGLMILPSGEKVISYAVFCLKKKNRPGGVSDGGDQSHHRRPRAAREGI